MGLNKGDIILRKQIIIITIICSIFAKNIFAIEKNTNENRGKKTSSKEQSIDKNTLRKPKRFNLVTIGGLGVIAGFGANRGVGEINYEWLAGQPATDTGHNDDYGHIATFSAGIRFGYVYALFMFTGFNIDVLYQRFGMKINNEKYIVSGSPQTGNEIDLELDYLVINPSFQFSLFSLGLYFGILLRAQAEELNVYDKITKMDFGFTVALEIPIPITKYNDGLFVIFEGVFGVIDLLKDSTRSIRNLAFYFKLAYLFNLKNRLK